MSDMITCKYCGSNKNVSYVDGVCDECYWVVVEEWIKYPKEKKNVHE